MLHENKKLQRDADISETFADYFRSVYDQSPANINLQDIFRALVPDHACQLNIFSFTHDDLALAFKKMKPKIWPDLLPLYFFESLLAITYLG